MFSFLLVIFLLIFINCLLLYYNHPIAQLFNLFDNPDKKRKFHKKSVPITGGILIISNLLFFLLF